MRAWLLATALIFSGCAVAPRPAPSAGVVPDTSPQPPGYLGFGFTYHKPDPAQTGGGWLMVRHVPDDGPAYRAGLQPQSVITAINGRPLDFPDDSGMLTILEAIRPGDVVRLTLGGHDPRELTLVAAELPPDKLRIWKANFEPAPQPVRRTP